MFSLNTVPHIHSLALVCAFFCCRPLQSRSGEGLYYVIDINYFPGVDKIPNFEAVFVDFLRSACSGEPQSQS